MKVKWSHAVINVRNLEKMLDFYRQVLGFVISDRGPIVPGGPEIVFLSTDADEHHQQQEADVHRAQHLGRYRVESGGDDLEDGKQQRDGEQRLRPVGRAGAHTLILLTHGVQTS